MTRSRLTWMGALVLGVAAAVSHTAAAQTDRTRVGTLTCDISPGLGLIVGSQREVTCVFTPSRGGRREAYLGTITRVGLDVGATAGGQMVWAVFAPSSARYAALAGNYVGASGEATLGAGLGANALIGGSNRTVALQPISVQGQVGLNLAVGVAGLALNPVR
jgi:hypothetical protein